MNIRKRCGIVVLGACLLLVAMPASSAWDAWVPDLRPWATPKGLGVAALAAGCCQLASWGLRRLEEYRLNRDTNMLRKIKSDAQAAWGTYSSFEAGSVAPQGIAQGDVIVYALIEQKLSVDEFVAHVRSDIQKLEQAVKILQEKATAWKGAPGWRRDLRLQVLDQLEPCAESVLGLLGRMRKLEGEIIVLKPYLKLACAVTSITKKRPFCPSRTSGQGDYAYVVAAKDIGRDLETLCACLKDFLASVELGILDANGQALCQAGNDLVQELTNAYGWITQGEGRPVYEAQLQESLAQEINSLKSKTLNHHQRWWL